MCSLRQVLLLAAGLMAILTAQPTFAAEFKCENGTTMIKSMWKFSNSKTCTGVVAEVVDFYDIDYRRECQRWLNENDLPHIIANSYVTDCFTYSNGTIRYKAKICCKGVITAMRCFSGTNITIQKDSMGSPHRYHTDYSNHHGLIETCAAGEVCQTQQFLVLIGNTSQTSLMNKGCVSADSCFPYQTNNSLTCRYNYDYGRCTYCCNDSFCNYDMQYHTLYRRQPGYCYNGGTLVKNATLDAGYHCICKPGSYGSICQWTNCNKYCKNGAQCIARVGEDAFAPFYYDCYCRIGYHGQNCTERYDNCTINVCLNGGTCYDQMNGTRCHCLSGYVGEFCQYKLETCEYGAKNLSYEFRSWAYGQNVATRNYNCSSIASRYLLSPYYWNTNYRSHCSSMYRKGFVEGRHGHVPVIKGAIKSCEAGDRALWYTFKLCCSPCHSNPCQNGGWCNQAVNSRGYVCQCRHGYEGFHCETKVALCFVAGDPHYITFDRKFLHFQGTCKYNLASSSGCSGNLPDFEVLVKNELRPGNTHVSYTRYVEIHVFGYVVILDRDNVVWVDEGDGSGLQEVDPPQTYLGGGLSVEFRGRFVRASTNFSLVVESDGSWTTMVKVSPGYKTCTFGLCANFNDDPEDDLTTSTGQDVRNDPYRYSLVGNSWQVDDPDVANCTGKNDTDPPECPKEMQAMVANNSYCGLISDNLGVFSSCIGNSEVIPLLTNMYMSCEFDVCANAPDLEAMKEAACGSLEMFAALCVSVGVDVIWRGVAECPLECPANMTYKEQAPSCPATCAKPNHPNECSQPPAERCACAENMLQRGKLCVLPSECGCVFEGQHYEIGDSWMSDNCTRNYTCVDGGKLPPRIGFTYTSCLRNETCKNGTCVSSIVHGGWSPWNNWSPCERKNCCDPGTQTRNRTCTKPVPSQGGRNCSGSCTQSRSPCPCIDKFDPDVDCEKCPEREDGQRYLEHPCNCTLYRQCVRRPDGSWYAHVRPAPPCTCFDQDTLSFFQYSYDCDVTEQPDVTAVVINDRCWNGQDWLAIDVGDPTQYLQLVNGNWVSRPCAPGTAFDIQTCRCNMLHRTTTRDTTTTRGPTVPADTCVNFTKWSPWGVSLKDYGWRWVANRDVKQQPVGPPCVSGPCGNFNGQSSMLQIFHYQNNYPKHFAITMWVHRNMSGGLFTNGDCTKVGSISAGVTAAGLLEVSVCTTSGTATIQVKVQQAFFLAVSYDGVKLDVFVNGDLKSQPLTGDLKPTQCTLAFGYTQDHGYFSGYMDQICFYAKGLSIIDMFNIMFGLPNPM